MTSKRQFDGLTAGALAGWQSLSAERRENARRWPAPAPKAAAIERLKSAG